jgi:hypothetical protein
MIASRTARTSVAHGGPPNFADGLCGLLNAHCASVGFERKHRLSMTISAWLRADLMLSFNTATQNFQHSLSAAAPSITRCVVMRPISELSVQKRL